MNYAKAIKKLRNKKKLTQSQFADLLGCTQSHISQIEKGVHNPSMNFLSVVSKFTDTPILDILKYALKHKNK